MEEEFQHFLKRGGRSPSAVKRCVTFVKNYERFLREELDKRLGEASPRDLETFAAWGEENIGPKLKTYLWAIRYYYEFTSNEEMRLLASELRQERISRIPFKLKDFRGVDQDHVNRLGKIGIRDIKEMLEAGRTESMRKDLSNKTGIPLDSILEIVKLSDLARIPGMKSVRTRLYYDAGFDTLDKLAKADPREVRRTFVEFVEWTGFDGIAALPKEIECSIGKAKELPRMVEF